MSPRIPFKEGREMETSFDLLPIGRYRAKVKKAIYNKKEGKTPHFSLRWHVAEGQYAGEFLCFDRIMLAGKGLGPSIVKLRMMGFDVDSQDEGRIEESDFFDRQAILTVEQRKWTRQDGKVQVDLQPVFDRDINFGYESVEPLAATAPEEPPVDPLDPDVPF